MHAKLFGGQAIARSENWGKLMLAYELPLGKVL